MYIHLFWYMADTIQPPLLPCACANLRRLTRRVTQLYEEALRPTGLRSTQFTLLQALSLTGEVTQNQLGELLAIDSTTLSRSLAPLVKKGWISTRAGRDRRERWLRLSEAGKRKLQSATPSWKHAQTKLHKQIGPALWQDLIRVSHQALTQVVPNKEELL
jgi:DNA-binding MarR family transcriptional regulator